jgi:hypothetical protein
MTNNQISRFNWPSEVSCAIATTILEDKSFVAAFIKKSCERLGQHYTLTTKILDQAGINYIRDGYYLLSAILEIGS